MTFNRYALWNTETQCDEGYQYMTKADAEQRNYALCSLEEPYRWVPDFNHNHHLFQWHRSSYKR